MPSKPHFIMLIKVTMPSISWHFNISIMINTPIESLKARKVCLYFSALYFLTHLSLVEPQNAPYTICSLEVHIVYPAYTICSPLNREHIV